ncbi:hypothetical protein [Prosthecobacter sp.]|uniref:hypothetical protein n=1 Tax=Prosthecobacter sp. TaxID=1965333 RepID=UPI0037844586
MLTKQELIGIAVAMTRSNQLAALNDPSFPSNEMCLRGDAPLFRRMVAIAEELYDGFDYARTPESLKSLKGRSEAYKAMRLKMLTPVKKEELLKRFSDAVARILESDEAFELTESVKHERLKELRTLLLEVSNVSGASVV